MITPTLLTPVASSLGSTVIKLSSLFIARLYLDHKEVMMSCNLPMVDTKFGKTVVLQQRKLSILNGAWYSFIFFSYICNIECCAFIWLREEVGLELVWDTLTSGCSSRFKRGFCLGTCIRQACYSMHYSDHTVKWYLRYRLLSSHSLLSAKLVQQLKYVLRQLYHEIWTRVGWVLQERASSYLRLPNASFSGKILSYRTRKRTTGEQTFITQWYKTLTVILIMPDECVVVGGLNSRKESKLFG